MNNPTTKKSGRPPIYTDPVSRKIAEQRRIATQRRREWASDPTKFVLFKLNQCLETLNEKKETKTWDGEVCDYLIEPIEDFISQLELGEEQMIEEEEEETDE
jgi:hypothetical protein